MTRTFHYQASNDGEPVPSNFNIRAEPPGQPGAIGTTPRVTLGDGPGLVDNSHWRPVWSGPLAPTEGPDPEHPQAGLLTTAQSICISIIVAIFDEPTDVEWSHAWITHISDWRSYKVWDIISKITPANQNQAYVAIAGQTSRLEYMTGVQKRFMLGGPLPEGTAAVGQAPAVARQPSPAPAQIWTYAADVPAAPGNHFGFGIDRAGKIGQVFGLIPKPL